MATRLKTIILGSTAVALSCSPAGLAAQKLGKGGTMVNDQLEIPRCSASLGTVALVETKKQDNASGQLPPGLAALMAMARAQNGMSDAQVDPMPLLRMIIARSGCFQVVDRGEGFDALQRERALASGQQTTGGSAAATLTLADYLLTANIVYQDENVGSGGGALGGLGRGFGGLGGLKSKKLETQTVLSVTAVKTGIQETIASGQARKRDLKVLAGGLVGLGNGALGGADSTDIGKLTAARLVDAFSHLEPQLEATLARQLAARQPQPVPAPNTP